MKLEEAASILGVSLEDITVDGLKQTYKKLALTWDAEKNSADQNSKSKYLQITEAYKKLASVMDGKDPYKVDDSHEIAAFMRMFMDMVGISENDSIPAAMTFGMMFGANQNVVEEWSTDEDGDEEYDDDDDDEDCEDEEDDEEYLPDEYFDEYAAVANGGPIPMSMPMHANPYAQAMGASRPAAQPKSSGPAVEAWEPQVKQYSNMNLKDQLNAQRMQAQGGELADDDSEQEDDAGEAGEELNDAEKERKLKLAKKRAEKRKKQKEKDKKKSKEASASTEDASAERKGVAKDFVDYTELSPEELTKLIRLHTDHIITELMHSVTNGQLGKVNQILSFDFAEEVPAAVAEEMVALLRQELPTTPVLHQCVTNLARMASGNSAASTNAGSGGGASGLNAGADGASSAAFNTAMFTALAARRLEVARYLLNFSRPAFEIGTVNPAGLSVLHHAIANGDLKIAQLIIRAITQVAEDRKVTLNINSRCHRQGWAPIHYAVEKLDVEAVKLLAQNGANVQVTMATDKRQTPLELARQKLKSSNAAGKSAAQAVIDELQAAIERNKLLKEAESKSKKLEAAGAGTSSATESTGKTATPPVSTSSGSATKEKEKKGVVEPHPSQPAEVVETSSKADKKKKKKDKETKEKTPSSGAAPVVAPVATPVPNPPAAKAETPAVAMQAPTPTPATASKVIPVPPTVAPVPAKGKKGKNAKNAAAPVAAPEPTINAMAEMSVSSRDELVDRLLAMGFREADCLQAISLYGTDTDQAISWLVERPAVVTPSPAPAPITKAENVKSKDVPVPITLAAAMALNPPRSAPFPAPTALTGSGSPGPAGAAAAPSSAQKLQKEKEELRRINRAWNLKAEDEKRKAEAQRKQAEIEKQLADLAAKQQQELLRQQQAQQEFAYQQHLQHQQQYMALHQQQMQSYFAAQQAAMFGGGTTGVGTGADISAAVQYAGMNNAGNSNFSMGSLQHMTNMLGTPGGAAQGSSSSTASTSSFGAHPSIGAASASSGHSSGGSALQTLSGAMAMAMGSDSHQTLHKPASSGTAAPVSVPSLSDVMAMSYSTPPAPAQAQSSSSLTGGGSSSGLFGLNLSSASAGVSSSGSLSSGQNSLGLFGHSQMAGDSLADFSFSGGLMGDSLFGPRDGIVDGALELSAGAKPFVPRFGSSASSAATASPASSTLSGAPSLGAFGLNSSTLGSGLGGLGLGGATSLGWDAKPSTGGSKISSFLSNLLPSDLNLDEDNFGYGDDAIIPGLESFLLNDN